jgi:glutamyl-tRNA reductase
MAELAAKNLAANGAKGLSVINRSQGRAQRLADQFGARALGWERITQALWNVDIVISSTSAPRAIIHPDTVHEAMLMRHNRPLFFIDIAVPRDVDPAVGDLPGVFLYNIDDLQAVVQTNLAHRRKEIPKAEAIINQEMAAFMSWFRALDVVPTIVELRQHAEEIRRAELEKALRRLEDLSDHERNIIQALTYGIVNKILHRPTIRLKDHANSRDGYHYTEAVRDLFGLCYDNGKDGGGKD